MLKLTHPPPEPERVDATARLLLEPTVYHVWSAPPHVSSVSGVLLAPPCTHSPDAVCFTVLPENVKPCSGSAPLHAASASGQPGCGLDGGAPPDGGTSGSQMSVMLSRPPGPLAFQRSAASGRVGREGEQAR